MTRIVMEEQGTLDKYIGDAVMALFNAPLPVPDHPQRAAEAALRMQEELVALNRGFAADFGLELAVGIGIHCGEAVVGNIGGTRRFEYTAMGDSVNLASRLEGLSKLYGVPIVISGTLAGRLPPERFVSRRLDRIRVKGKQQVVEVHELMGWAGDAGLASRRDAFEAALEAYFDGRFDAATAAFERACRVFRKMRRAACSWSAAADSPRHTRSAGGTGCTSRPESEGYLQLSAMIREEPFRSSQSRLALLWVGDSLQAASRNTRARGTNRRMGHFSG